MNAVFMAVKRSLAGRAHPGAEREKMRSRALARPLPEAPHHVVQPSARGLCFFWQKIGSVTLAPLARPAVPDILSTVADPAVKVYICLWRKGCNTR